MMPDLESWRTVGERQAHLRGLQGKQFSEETGFSLCGKLKGKYGEKFESMGD
jgi:hypothetical protein